MAGTLEINDTVAWMPAAGAFDNALERIAAELERDAPQLASELLHARTDISGGYYDLRNADSDTFKVFLNAVVRAYETLRQEEESAFYDSRYRLGYLTKFLELKNLLSTDERATDIASDNAAAS